MEELEKRLEKFGSKPGLSRIKKLLKKWGNPQNKLKVILVSGTNGKGSTVSYLASILKESGFRVGSYFSPHLIKYNERIKVNGNEIKNREFVKYRKRIEKYLKKGGEITIFEAMTAIAFEYFKDKGCDYAVMEIGMGGRFDACNIAYEEIAVVTNIGLEHSKWLGETREKIAYEKIGILKKGIGITGARGVALNTIKQYALRRRKLCILDENFRIERVKTSERGMEFDYFGKKHYEKLKVKMAGEYQARNAALAIRAAEELRVDEKAIRKGLKKAKIRGRLEIIKKRPRILIDVAHNPSGVRELIKNLGIFDYKKLILVFGVMKDKDWKRMIRLLSKESDEIILTKPGYYRAEDPSKIKEFLGKGKVINSPKKALKYAEKITKKENLILVTGSIYFIGEILS